MKLPRLPWFSAVATLLEIPLPLLIGLLCLFFLNANLRAERKLCMNGDDQLD